LFFLFIQSTGFSLSRTVILICMALTGILFSGNAFSQTSLPKGKFLSDSIEVGKPFYYALSFRHAPKTEVFFPDTTYNFSPFEVISKKSFTSSTDQKGSLDSAIYQLVTFNVGLGQTLKVPVFIFNGKDCTAVFTATDSIFLSSSNFNGITDTTSLKPETDLLPLNHKFNFSIFIGFFALAVGVFVTVYWLFGSDIYKQWQLIKLQRRHMEYNRSYNRLLKNARERNDIKDAEKAIIVWKNYLERLEKKPFATYTTREIMDNMPDEDLAGALKNMDAIIYGQEKSREMDKSLEILKMGAMRLYRNKRRYILESKTSSEN
jgi:hypothetical protein